MPAKKTKLGRPPIMSEEIASKLEEAFKIDCTVEEACAYAGISDTTYYKERQINPAFADRMDRAMQYPFLAMKRVVAHAAETKNHKIAMTWLKSRQRERYHEKQVVQPQEATSYDDLEDKPATLEEAKARAGE